MSRKLLEGGIVVPVDGKGSVIRNGAVLLEGGEIRDVGERSELLASYDYDEKILLRDKVILPGFVNVHSHSGFIRGLAEDLPVFEWLDKHVDPTYRAMKPKEARAAYQLCFAEGIRSGITCTLDMWQYMEQAADVAEEYGTRTILVPYVADGESHDYLSSLDDNLQLVKRRHGDSSGKIRIWFGIEHLSYASKETMTEAFELAEEYDVGFHTHVEESKEMSDDIEHEYGKRPIELFEDWDILDSRCHFAHCVWPTSNEIRIMAENNVSVAHCPTANQKLGSGVAPIPEMISEGITIGLGSDGIKANNRIDLIQEMKLAALLQKVHHLDPTFLPAQTMLRMATIEGARALGLENKIGSLSPGKRADIAIFDIDTFHMSPVLHNDYSNVIPNLVHSLQGRDADSVMVDGKFLLRNGEFVPDDKEYLLKDHKYNAKQLLKRRDGRHNK